MIFRHDNFEIILQYEGQQRRHVVIRIRSSRGDKRSGKTYGSQDAFRLLDAYLIFLHTTDGITSSMSSVSVEATTTAHGSQMCRAELEFKNGIEDTCRPVRVGPTGNLHPRCYQSTAGRAR